jgi:phage shock protein A
MASDIEELISELSEEDEPLRGVLTALLRRIEELDRRAEQLEATVKTLESRVQTPIKMGGERR